MNMKNNIKIEEKHLQLHLQCSCIIIFR